MNSPKLVFEDAERKEIKLKIGLSGPSGSGKTLSSLLLAKGMLQEGWTIAVLDTENGSASLYADTVLPDGTAVPKFKTLKMGPPYTTDKYLAGIQTAVEAGFQILIIDSGSHQWAGEGGLLARKEQMDARPGSNSYANWAKMTPEHEKFKSAILHSDIHIIFTLRSKQDYVLSQNDKGKQVPQKVGMAPVQREGMEYELTCMLDLDMSHQATTSKDRTGLFDGKVFVPGTKAGKALMAWLAGAKPAQTKKPEPTKESPAPVADPDQESFQDFQPGPKTDPR